MTSNNSTDCKPFFILGCARSGTSLVSRMLNQHPRIAVPYESHLYNTFYTWLKYYGSLEDDANIDRLITDILATDVMNDWDPQLSREEVWPQIKTRDFGGVVQAILSAYARKNGKPCWGEKTPQHAFFWDAINSAIPEARVIHIVRDGRDVALSLLNARFGPKTVYGCAHFWNRYLDQMERIKGTVKPENLFEVQYERLLEEPETELRKICDFLGESYEPSMLEFYQNKSRYQTDPQNLQNLMNPVLKDNKQKWRSRMSVKEISVFEAISSRYLKKYGYELGQDEGVSLTTLQTAYYRFLSSPVLKLRAMLKNTKGHRDALIRLKIFLRLRFVDRLSRDQRS